jgi:hypothetical protein
MEHGVAGQDFWIVCVQSQLIKKYILGYNYLYQGMQIARSKQSWNQLFHGDAMTYEHQWRQTHL